MTSEQEETIRKFLEKSGAVSSYQLAMGIFILNIHPLGMSQFSSEFNRFNESNGIQFSIIPIVQASTYVLIVG